MWIYLYFINLKTNYMKNFTLKFGKYKGQLFLSTPVSYQNWLLSQDWFKAPTQLTELQKASKQIALSVSATISNCTSSY